MAFPLNFDDIAVDSSGYGTVPKGYGSLHWTNFYVVNPSEYSVKGGAGYANGIVSGDQEITNGSGNPASVLLKDGTFTLQQMFVTSVFAKSLTIDAYGYKDGQELFHESFKVIQSNAAFVKLSFVGVDQVTFVASDPVGGHGRTDFVIDDLTTRHIFHDPAAPVDHGLGAVFGASHQPLVDLATLHGAAALGHEVHPLA